MIPISETLHQQLREEAREEVGRDLADDRKALADREKGLAAKEKCLLETEESLEQRVQDRLTVVKEQMAEEALTKARDEMSVEVRALRETTNEQETKLREAQENELALRRERRELEDAKKELELRTQRTIDAERATIREAAAKEALDDHRLKDAEKDRKLSDVLRINEELKRKLEQGSQQSQGETLEHVLEAILVSSCPDDAIEPVAKGVRGADVLQRVRTRGGLLCGSILWETKRTKNWSDGWIAKLKEDQQEAKADIAILVSEALPKDVREFGQKDGVWVTTPRSVPALLAALRHALIEVALVKAASASKNETVETLFRYLTGAEFRRRVEAIVRGFVRMREDHEEEKRTTMRRWSKREKQLDLIVGNTSGMYGDLQGLLGPSMKPIAALETGKEDESSSSEETGAVTAAPIGDDVPVQ